MDPPGEGVPAPVSLRICATINWAHHDDPADSTAARRARAGPLLFTHAGTLHGQAHVSRVMVYAFRLIAATGWIEEAPRLWASVYLHDLARTHDGLCYRHAVAR